MRREDLERKDERFRKGLFFSPLGLHFNQYLRPSLQEDLASELWVFLKVVFLTGKEACGYHPRWWSELFNYQRLDLLLSETTHIEMGEGPVEDEEYAETTTLPELHFRMKEKKRIRGKIYSLPDGVDEFPQLELPPHLSNPYPVLVLVRST